MKQLRVEAKVENLGRVQEFVRRQLEGYGCREKSLQKVAIAVDEIFSNIAQYAYAPGTGPVTVEVELLEPERAACITFADEGAAYDPLETAPPDLTLAADSRPMGGLGVYLVRKFMDGVHYTRDGGKNVLQIVKKMEEQTA